MAYKTVQHNYTNPSIVIDSSDHTAGYLEYTTTSDLNTKEVIYLKPGKYEVSYQHGLKTFNDSGWSVLPKDLDAGHLNASVGMYEFELKVANKQPLSMYEVLSQGARRLLGVRRPKQHPLTLEDLQVPCDGLSTNLQYKIQPNDIQWGIKIGHESQSTPPTFISNTPWNSNTTWCSAE